MDQSVPLRAGLLEFFLTIIFDSACPPWIQNLYPDDGSAKLSIGGGSNQCRCLWQIRWRGPPLPPFATILPTVNFILRCRSAYDVMTVFETQYKISKVKVIYQHSTNGPVEGRTRYKTKME